MPPLSCSDVLKCALIRSDKIEFTSVDQVVSPRARGSISTPETKADRTEDDWYKRCETADVCIVILTKDRQLPHQCDGKLAYVFDNHSGFKCILAIVEMDYLADPRLR